MLGIVVPVPEPWAQLLVDWRSKVGDPQASLVPPHVTLLPPTEVAVADRPAISAHLADVARGHPPFEMHLSGHRHLLPGVRASSSSRSPRASATASSLPPTCAAARSPGRSPSRTTRT